MSGATTRKIYQRIIDVCPVAGSHGPWNLGHPTGVVHGVSDPHSLLESLSADFGEAALVEASVVRIDAAKPKLADALCGDLLVALMHPQRQDCWDILCADGCISQQRIPVFAALSETHTLAHRSGADARLFVVADIADVARLRSLDMPTTLATGLDTLKPGELLDLCRRCNRDAVLQDELLSGESFQGRDPLLPIAEKYARMERKPVGHWTLTLVDWSLHSFDVVDPGPLQPLVELLQEMSRHLRVRFGGIQVWCPTPEDLERFAFFGWHDDSTRFRQALLESASESSCPLHEVTGHHPAVAPQESTLPDATLALVKVMNDDDATDEERAAALARYHDSVEADLAGPLMGSALEASSLERRVLKLDLAALTRIAHSCYARCYRGSAGKAAGSQEQSWSRDIQQTLRASAAMERVIRQLRRI